MRKALAFVAMSQQGIALLALGCGAFTAALFFWIANALVMALLFLSAGSVSRALSKETNVARMGDLGRRLVSTCWSFRVGAAVLVGFPLGSIFFSRGGVLAACFGSELPGREWLSGMALGATLLVSFAVCRLYLLIFSGESRVPRELRDRVRESPGVMLGPLFAFAALSAFAGLFGIPQFFADFTPMQVQSSHSLENFLATTLPTYPIALSDTEQLWLTLVASLAGVTGFGIAYGIYVAKPAFGRQIAASIPTLRRILQERLYLDRAEEALVTKPLFLFADRVLFRGSERLLDRWLVLGSARLLRASAQWGLRYLHAGLLHGYMFFMIAGTAAVLGYLLH